MSDVAVAAFACANAGANVISMSLGGAESSIFEQTVVSIMQTQYNILIVASAGNSADTGYMYPASYPSVLSVGAVDRNSNVASFSQRNDQVNLAWLRLDSLNIFSIRFYHL